MDLAVPGGSTEARSVRTTGGCPSLWRDVEQPTSQPAGNKVPPRFDDRRDESVESAVPRKAASLSISPTDIRVMVVDVGTSPNSV